MVDAGASGATGEAGAGEVEAAAEALIHVAPPCALISSDFHSACLRKALQDLAACAPMMISKLTGYSHNNYLEGGFSVFWAKRWKRIPMSAEH